jgi:hypothetical protein
MGDGDHGEHIELVWFMAVTSHVEEWHFGED